MRDISGIPVIKTLLLLDFVDSTQIVDNLGDQRAAEVFAAHDRIARDLVREYEGQEIDKTDGFLLIFARPFDATRYALAYHKALNELAVERNVPLGARAGIHLGEVVLRANRPEDVARGAKPVELEGLAKPMVARIMSLASAGQTVLTQTAFDLARRAAVGSGDLSTGTGGPGDPVSPTVEWLEHGFYRLKGIKEPVKVCEVGQRGLAPLSPPADSAKGHRVRSSRRPMVVAWALATLAVSAVVALFLMYPWAPKETPESASLAAAVKYQAERKIIKVPAPATAPPERVSPRKRIPLAIHSEPAGATLRLNKVVIGTTPLDEPVDATPGVHVFEASLAGHQSDLFRCRITETDIAKGSASCGVTLRPMPAKPSDSLAPAGIAPTAKPSAQKKPAPVKKPATKKAPEKNPLAKKIPKKPAPPRPPERRPAIQVID